MLRTSIITKLFGKKKSGFMDQGGIKATLYCGYVKDTMKLLKKEFYHMSPALGCALLNSHWLTNMYQSAPDYLRGSNVGRLVQAMFYKESANDNLHATKNRSLAPTWLNPERVASVIAHLEDADRAKDDLKKCVVSWAKEAGLTQKRVHEFVGLVAKANNECEHAATEKPMFPKYTVHSILLAFMWERAQSKRELFPYYQKLDSIFDAISKDEKKCLNEWFESRFEPDLKMTDPTHVNDCRDYEIAAHLRTLKRFASEVPPIPKGYNVGEDEIADCAEAATRSIVNLIVFDPSRLVFDTSLISSNAKPMQSLIEFYNGTNQNGIPRNLASTELTSYETAATWFDAVSNLSGVAYCQDNYELEPNDILRALTTLFGFSFCDISSFADLASQLSTPRVKIEVVEETSNDEDDQNDEDDEANENDEEEEYDEDDEDGEEEEELDNCVKFTFNYDNGCVIRADLSYSEDHASVRYYRHNPAKTSASTVWKSWIHQKNELNDIVAPLMALSGAHNALEELAKKKSVVDHLSQVAKWHLFNSLPCNPQNSYTNYDAKIAFMLKGEIRKESLKDVYVILGRLKTGVKRWIRKLIQKRDLVDFEELLTMQPKLFKSVAQVAISEKEEKLAKHLLTLAIQQNNMKIVHLLFKAGYANDFKSVHDNWSLLHYAVRSKSIQFAQDLLEQGVDPNVQTTRGESPLHLAVKLGDTKMVRLLLSKGSHVNQCDVEKTTPLHYAVEGCDRKMIKVLLQHKADKTAANQFGVTPLALLNEANPALSKLLSDKVPKKRKTGCRRSDTKI